MENKRFHKMFVSKTAFVLLVAFGAVVGVTVTAATYPCHNVTEVREMPSRLTVLTLMMLLQDLTQLAAFPDVVRSLPPGAIIARSLREEPRTRRTMLAVFGGLVVSEVVSFIAVFTTLRTLKRNARCFTRKTYRLHLQLTALILLQVIPRSVLDENICARRF